MRVRSNRLKSQVTKGQITSTTEELKSQDKMEESVSQVDFDQLQIKNREYVHYLSEGALCVMKRRMGNRSLPASKSRCYVLVI